MIISVAVCTHNRADLLATVLDSLCRQAIASRYYEIVVIDNASTDQTRQVAAQFAQHHPNVRYCHEPILGHSAARNRAWREAAGAYVAYIDDDAIAPENWLSTAVRVIQRERPSFFGGPYHAYYQSPKPAWFKDAYGSASLGDAARTLKDEEFLSATNIFVRHDVLEEIGGFDAAYGGAGVKLGYAEETELQQRLRNSRPAEAIYYEPQLYVYHLVKSERMSIKWRLRSSFVMGRYHYRFLASRRLRSAKLWQTLAMLFVRSSALLILLSCGLLFRDRNRYPYWKNYAYETGPRYLRMIGGYYEHTQTCLSKEQRERVHTP